MSSMPSITNLLEDPQLRMLINAAGGDIQTLVNQLNASNGGCQEVEDGRLQPQLGVRSSAEVSTTSGNAENAQATPPATSGNNESCYYPTQGQQPTTTPSMSSTTGKRSRPDDLTTPIGNSKRPRMGTSETDTEVNYAANELSVAVMTEPFCVLTEKQANGIWAGLEKKLVDDLLKPLTLGQTVSVGSLDKPHLIEGVFRVCCKDDVALKWLRRAVQNMVSPIAGSTLVVRPQSEIVRRIACELFVPKDTFRMKINNDTIRQVLTNQNKFVDISSWSFVKAKRQTRPLTPGVYLFYRVPESEVNKLKEQEYCLDLMMSRIPVRNLEEEYGTAI